MRNLPMRNLPMRNLPMRNLPMRAWEALLMAACGGAANTDGDRRFAKSAAHVQDRGDDSLRELQTDVSADDLTDRDDALTAAARATCGDDLDVDLAWADDTLRR